jgi:hypothetical protein
VSGAATIFAWLGTGLQIAGAIALATRWLSPKAAYSIMLPGALIWLVIAVLSKDWPLAAMQGTFAVINAVGIVRWRG